MSLAPGHGQGESIRFLLVNLLEIPLKSQAWIFLLSKRTFTFGENFTQILPLYHVIE